MWIISYEMLLSCYIWSVFLKKIEKNNLYGLERLVFNVFSSCVVQDNCKPDNLSTAGAGDLLYGPSYLQHILSLEA